MAEYIKELCKVSNSIKVQELIPQSLERIYHYTSPGGLSGIIENGKLRFSDRYFLNDASEGRYIIKLCIDQIENLGIPDNNFREKFIKECKKRIQNLQRDNFYIFQCSFSEDADSLCLWNYYTKGESVKGYNLAFRAEELLTGLSPTPLEKDGRCPKAIGGKVVYLLSEQLDIIKAIASKFLLLSNTEDFSKYDEMTVEYLLDKIMFVGTFFKDEHFGVENEYRIAFNLYLQDDGTYASIGEKQQFREMNGIFIPYVDITFDKNILNQITISPTLDTEFTKQSIQRMVKNEYSNLLSEGGIIQSQIPVRY